MSPGGTVLIKEFEASSPEAVADDLPTLEEVISAFDGFQPTRAEVVAANHAHGHDHPDNPGWLALIYQAEKSKE